MRESIHAIDEEIEKARAAKRPAARLLANRRDLLIRLVEAEVTNDGAGLQGSELQEVQSQQRKLDEQRSAVEPIRTDLLPPNPVEMRRAVLGIGIAVLAIIVFGLSGRSKYPSVNHGTDDAVVGVQSQSKKMGGEAGAGTALTAQAGSSSLDKEIALDLGNGVKLEMVLIPAGEFLMGSPDSDKDALSEEKPQHRVRITKPFFMGKYLVTQEQWDVVMGSNPSEFKGPKNPVESLSWDDCQKFLDKLNAKSHPGGGRFQLPSEAQWEYACRAGSTTKYCFGDEESGLGEYAWYNANSDSKTHPVGEKKSNRWGLYDMHGNEWEWCADWHNNDYYKESPTDDPTGAATGSFRVARGGGWSFPAAWARSAARHAFEPGGRCLALRVSQVPAEVFAETRVSESGSQEGNAVKTPPLSRSRDEDASKFQPVSAERTRAPRASSLYPIRESRESGVSELRADLGVVDKGSDYQASCSLVYDYFGASVPTTVDWKQFEVVISVKSTIRVENNPLGGLWKRGKVGYGGSRITIKIDEEVYGGKADFNSEEHGDLMYERLAVSITKEVATAIRDAKSVSIIAGSADLPLIFHLDDEMVGAFRNLIDRVARSR